MQASVPSSTFAAKSVELLTLLVGETLDTLPGFARGFFPFF